MKKGFVFTSAALTALTLIATASPAFADVTSTNTVTFSASDTPSVTPQIPGVPDPTDPSKPNVQPPLTVTPNTGSLALDKATDINFGSYKVDGSTTEFTAKTVDNGGTNAANGSAVNYQPAVVWHDLRGAGSSAFTISASTTGFSDMKDATITLGAGTASNLSGNGATDVTSVTPAGDVTLTNDGSANLIAKDSGAVSGVYDVAFSKATLYVPVNEQSTTAMHSATVTWTLSATPSN